MYSYIFSKLSGPDEGGNYTRQESKRLLESQGLSSKGGGEEMVAAVSKNSATDAEKSQVSKQDVRLLLDMCTELVNLCAKLTGKIDPAAAAMLAYVRDDIASENKNERDKIGYGLETS